MVNIRFDAIHDFMTVKQILPTALNGYTDAKVCFQIVLNKGYLTQIEACLQMKGKHLIGIPENILRFVNMKYFCFAFDICSHVLLASQTESSDLSI